MPEIRSNLPERDCSLQRNKQKMIEESPCALITDAQRKYLGELAIKAAEAIDYRNTGTIEFLMDQEHKFYFMEMNTRIQVEHTVTEMVTGVDLVKAQVKVALVKIYPLSKLISNYWAQRSNVGSMLKILPRILHLLLVRSTICIFLWAT